VGRGETHGAAQDGHPNAALPSICTSSGTACGASRARRAELELFHLLELHLRRPLDVRLGSTERGVRSHESFTSRRWMSAVIETARIQPVSMGGVNDFSAGF
jgi:hypothetical protein